MTKVKIKQFRNKAKEPVAGLTPEHAVYDENGVRLDAKLGNVDLSEFRRAQTEGINAIKAQQDASETYINNVVDIAKNEIDAKHTEVESLTQASMIGASTPGISGTNVQDNLNSIVATIEESKLFKFPNVTIIGSPNIERGQVSGFSKDPAAHMILPFSFDTTGKKFEFNVAFVTGSDVNTVQNIIGSAYCMAMYLESGKLNMRISNNGTSWDVWSYTHDALTFSPNTPYYIKLVFDGLNYSLKLSTNGTDYNTLSNLGATKRPHPGLIYLGIGNNYNNPFKGIINLNKCDILFNGEHYWEGMDDAGLATRMAVDMSNIDNEGKQRVNQIVNEGEVGEKLSELEEELDDTTSLVLSMSSALNNDTTSNKWIVTGFKFVAGRKYRVVCNAEHTTTITLLDNDTITSEPHRLQIVASSLYSGNSIEFIADVNADYIGAYCVAGASVVVSNITDISECKDSISNIEKTLLKNKGDIDALQIVDYGSVVFDSGAIDDNGYEINDTTKTRSNYIPLTLFSSANNDNNHTYYLYDKDMAYIDKIVGIKGETKTKTDITNHDNRTCYLRLVDNTMYSKFVVNLDVAPNINDKTGYVIDKNDFEIGGLNLSTSGYSPLGRDSRIRTKVGRFIHLNIGDVIKLASYSDARVYIWWMADGEYHVTGWITTGAFVVYQEGDYVLTMSNINERALSRMEDLFDLLIIESGITNKVLAQKIKDITPAPQKAVAYKGSRVVLNEENNRYDIDNVVSLTGDSCHANKLELCQSAEIYNDEVFLATTASVKKMSSQHVVIDTFLYNGISVHANALQFTKSYHIDGDAYPIAILSICNDVEGDFSGCYAVRFNNGVVQKLCMISSDILTYSWCADKNMIYAITYTLGSNYKVVGARPRILGWKIPSSFNEDIILHEKDATVDFSLNNYGIVQDCKAYNGRIYVSIYMYGSYTDAELSSGVWVVNIADQCIESAIPITTNGEIEGVAISGTSMFVTSRRYKEPYNFDMYKLTF